MNEQPDCTCTASPPHHMDCPLISYLMERKIELGRQRLREHQALSGGTGGFCACCGRQESYLLEHGHEAGCINGE